jgi:trehalose-6-phosphate synthase
MAETFYLRGRAANGPTVYHPHAYKSVNDALQEAERTLSEAGDLVWIVDGAENLVLPADQVRMRLQHRNGSLRRA